MLSSHVILHLLQEQLASSSGAWCRVAMHAQSHLHGTLTSACSVQNMLLTANRDLTDIHIINTIILPIQMSKYPF